MDNILGWVMENISDNTTLIVLSDHGFGDFERVVHLNSWLRDNGFLYLKGSKKESKEFFQDVDWSQTKAYALGFGGIYINQAGREASGIISPGEGVRRIKKEVIDKLSRWIDPKSGNLVVKKVYTKEEVFAGKHNQAAPDLYIGFNTGYRASWQTGLGAAPLDSIEDNLKAWRADHIFDPSLVDGVLFINRKINLHRKPKIIDMVPTILKLFDIEYNELDGNSLL
jgi:predicted AlkP superfamily phosphohydrolase/phosphomutase